MKKVKATKSKIDVGQELRNLGALLENNNHRIEAIGEQYLGINKKLDSHTEMIEELSSDMKIVKATLVSHTETLKSHTETLKSHTETLKSHTEMIGQNAEAISKVAIDVDIIKTNVEFVKEGMKKKVDYDEFLALERRMSVLESKINKA